MHRLLLLLAALASPAAHAVDSARLDADIAFVDQHEHLPGLAMAVVEDGQVVYRHTEGVRGDGGRIDEDTLFKIASNSKAMTAALLATLVVSADRPTAAAGTGGGVTGGRRRPRRLRGTAPRRRPRRTPRRRSRRT